MGAICSTQNPLPFRKALLCQPRMHLVRCQHGNTSVADMLAMTGGRERTPKQYAELYRAAGFELVRIVPVDPMLSVIEGRPS
jgi:hypothetical protein